MQNGSTVDRNNLMKYIMPQDLKSYGLIPELVGRLPVLTYMQPLSKQALRSILTEPRNAIVKQYVRLFAMDGVELHFDEDVLDYIVDKADEYKLGPGTGDRPAAGILPAVHASVYIEVLQ
mgnify:CR=1 FL=1